MERETLEQVRAYLEERRLESLNFEAIETTEADPVMLDLAKMVVEEKIIALEPKEGVGSIEVTINATGFATMVKDMINQIAEEFTTEQEEQEICLGLCKLEVPNTFYAEYEKSGNVHDEIKNKEKNRTLKEEEIRISINEARYALSRIIKGIKKYNKQLEYINHIVEDKKEPFDFKIED